MAQEPIHEDPVVHTPGHVHEAGHAHETEHLHEAEHLHEPVAPALEPVHDHTSSLTAYAVVKYGTILVMTIIILYFLARFVIPLFY
jgi:hypothetical protein